MTVPPLGEYTPAGIPPKVCRACGRSGEWPGQPCPECKPMRALLAELSMVSHAPISAYGRQTPDSGEDIGGKRPPGSEREHRPRAPKSPRIEGDARSEKLWDEFEEELAAWKACYHRRTVGYFQRRIDRVVSDGEMRQIRSELESTIKSWRVMRIPDGQPPTIDDPQWKRWVAESPLDTGEVARTFNVPRQYVQRIRKAYREAA